MERLGRLILIFFYFRNGSLFEGRCLRGVVSTLSFLIRNDCLYLKFKITFDINLKISFKVAEYFSG